MKELWGRGKKVQKRCKESVNCGEVLLMNAIRVFSRKAKHFLTLLCPLPICGCVVYGEAIEGRLKWRTCKYLKRGGTYDYNENP